MRWPALRSLRGLTVLFVALFLIATVGTGLTTYLANASAMTQLVDKRITTESMELSGRDERPVAARVADRIAAESRARDSADLGMVLEDRRAIRSPATSLCCARRRSAIRAWAAPTRSRASRMAAPWSARSATGCA